MAIDDVFAVIAEGTRRDILGSLRDGDKAVGELVEELEVSQPTVSKHLKVLREAGLVSMRAQGQKRYYSLRTGPLQDVAEWIVGFGVEVLPAAEPVAPVVAAAVVAPQEPGHAVSGRSLEVPVPANLSRSLGQAANKATTKAADLFAHLPKLPRRRRG
ncbi:ArsR/SmtB family transcription factor [Arthrobacter sulfonylureivorans]|uniref:ArsR/SmtB family transcription factor n=1 Tax=Arthrobacter TaxID=1663 RepID=UPI0010AD9E2D|nr:metalloregulator ArsR/SmtB family transcription factor [Arthrobacter sp. CAU 1506]TJY69868.1 winged helix-turn-helix transcriptional regulator [Arthrobacter sp. CAU 1506]